MRTNTRPAVLARGTGTSETEVHEAGAFETTAWPAEPEDGDKANIPRRTTDQLRIAIVHYWLISEAGGENVIKALLALYPHADVFTLIYDEQVARRVIGERRLVGSYLQRVPFARKMHRKLLLLMPNALENLDLSGYDLIISSESGPAKGILPPLSATHVCYCHSPMRYIWDQFWEYRRDAGFLARTMVSASVARLRQWDQASASRVDAFVANSSHVATRIARYYRRDAKVIHPPVETDSFAISDEVEDYYVITGRHVSYKRIDVAIRACQQLGRRLLITGQGPDTEMLKRLAGPGIEFLGHCSFAELKRVVARARAFLMPGEEDFGIAPVEAMASGRPVIALGRGGALDTVVDGHNGVLFTEASIEGLVEAIQRFERLEHIFDPQAIRAHAESFSRTRFAETFAAFVEDTLESSRHRMLSLDEAARSAIPKSSYVGAT